MATDTTHPGTPDPTRAGEFAMSMELMVEGSMKLFQAALWGGDEHTIAHARHNLENAYAQFLDCVEARVVAARLDLRRPRK